MTVQTNTQATRQKEWRTLTVQVVAFGLSSLAVSGFAVDHSGNSVVSTFLFVVGLLVLLNCVLAPTIIAIRALRITRRKVHAQGNEPLQITQLVSDAMYGSHDQLSVVIGTMPFLMCAVFYIVLYINSIFAHSMGCVGNYDQERFGCFLWPSPSNADLVNSLLSLTALAIAFWGLALLGASLGVGLGLRKWYTTPLVVIVLIALLLVSGGLALLMMQIPPQAHYVKMVSPGGLSGKAVYMLGQTPAENLTAVDPGLLPQSIIIMILPFAVAAGVMLLSRRYLPSQSPKGMT